MSTAWTSPPGADNTRADDTNNKPAEAKKPFLQRLPNAVFTTGYGALLVGAIVLGVVVTSYETDAVAPRAAVERPLRPILYAQTSQDNVNASLRTYLIDKAETARTHTGVALRGELTPSAVADTTEVSGHLSRLMEQNCLDSITLTTPDNMQINFWGFCYHTLPPETIQGYLDTALTGNARQLAFHFHPGRIREHHMWMTWMSEDEQAAKDAVESWQNLKILAGIDLLVLGSYGPDNVYWEDRTKFKKEKKTWPAGENFKQKYGVGTPALPAPEPKPE
ncbi:hypothetical protein [Corynebacterium mayonis]|uniref:hypothetical protein n=1 Tax=Corynebacterium mayonis TaxID=3062461 RepID=UPI00314058DA